MQCVGEFPLLKSLRQQFSDKDLAMIGVSVDTVCDRAREAVQRNGLSWPQACDGKAMRGEMAHLLNVEATPTYYVIDRDGFILGKKVDAEELRGILEKAVAAPASPALP
jgi:peroxiredoxin